MTTAWSPGVSTQTIAFGGCCTTSAAVAAATPAGARTPLLARRSRLRRRGGPVLALMARMLPHQTVDLRRTDPMPSFDEDPDLDLRDTNPCIFDPTAEYAAGYFRNTDPMLREPSEEDTEVQVQTQAGQASPKVVFSSVFLLSGLGLGAFLLMYSWVHGAEFGATSVAVDDVGVAAAQAEPAVAPPSIAPVPTPQVIETSPLPLAAEAVGTAASTANVTLAPLPTVLLTEPMKGPPAATPQTAPTRPEPTTADTAATATTNPYDDEPIATPPHPSTIAPPKATIMIHVEPNPVENPYGSPDDPAKPASPAD